MPHISGNEPDRSVRDLLLEEMERLLALRRRLSLRGNEDLICLTERALRVATCPACAESQADGVPCESTSAECDRCVKALGWIRSLRSRLEVEEREATGASAWEI